MTKKKTKTKKWEPRVLMLTATGKYRLVQTSKDNFVLEVRMGFDSMGARVWAMAGGEDEYFAREYLFQEFAHVKDELAFYQANDENYVADKAH